MNKVELLSQIGNRYRTVSRNFVSADEILNELNFRIKRLSGKVDLLTTIVQKTFTFTGNGLYTFVALGITDFKKPIELLDTTNYLQYSLVSKPFLDQDIINSNNEYALIGKSGIYISSAAQSITLRLTYYSKNDCFDVLGIPRVGLSADTDEPALQEAYQDYLVEEVASILFRKGKKWDDYKAAKVEAADIYMDIVDENVTQTQKPVELFIGYPQKYS